MAKGVALIALIREVVRAPASAILLLPVGSGEREGRSVCFEFRVCLNPFEGRI
jgi:hypothetical protein